MNRKILQAGPSTLAVSLPMDWVRRFRLRKGDSIFLEEQGPSLRINTTVSMEEESAAINISDYHPIGARTIGLLYKAGYRKIKVYYTPNKIITHKGMDVKELFMVRSVFESMIGMQMWDIGEKNGRYYATAVESAKVNPEEFDKVLNKLLLHIIQQAEMVCSSITDKKVFMDEAFLNERLIDQAADFCSRVLVSFSHKDYKKTLHYFNLVTKLESLGDRYYNIAVESKSNGTNRGKDNVPIDAFTLRILNSLTGIIREIGSLIRCFDKDKANTIINGIRKLGKDYKERSRQPDNGSKGFRSNAISLETYAIIIAAEEVIESVYFLNFEIFKDNT